MAELVLNWIADAGFGSDIIDLYFIVSDLIDIPISLAEATEIAFYDAMAANAVHYANLSNYGDIPIGKLAL